MNHEPTQDFYSVPIRRTRWTSFWIGVGAAFLAFVLAALLASALVGLLALLKVKGGGTLIIIAFGFLWFGLFFASYPLQRRYARSFDLRRPGIHLANGVLTAPLPDGSTLQFKLDEPHELSYGWWETLVTNITGPTLHVRVTVTHATLAQAGQHLFLVAEDATRDAKKAGWLKSSGVPQSKPELRLWSEDIVALVEAIRARTINSRQ